MLNSINLNDKSYEELLLEAVTQIPLYSSEWTNYNPSDPGMTMLENLTAFQLVQQEAINQVPEEVRRKLLQLVGFSARENRAAQLWVQAPPRGGELLPSRHQLWSGDIPFETTEEVELNPWCLSAVYAVSETDRRDITELMSPRSEPFAYPFGQHPESGSALVCVLSGYPELGAPIRLWLQVAQEELRNPFREEEVLPVGSQVRWQYYTAEGWRDARAEDETCALLRPGIVTLYLEGDSPATYDELPIRGCALRCLLEKAEYDRAPRLRALAAHLFPVLQQNTRVECRSFPGEARAELRGRLPRMGNLFVYCREEENGPFRFYREAYSPEQRGRFYETEQTPWGVVIHFSDRFGAVPWSGEDAVRVTCFDDEMVHHRYLGQVYGYEDQTMELERAENVLPDDFQVVLELEEPNGESAFWFASPDGTDPDSLCYRLLSHEGRLQITHPGMGRCRLYLASCVETRGSQGNLRPCTTLEQRGGYDGTEVETRYFSPAPGRFGVTYESVEELRRRFAARLQETAVAVRAEDYERLVQQTPGLCIHKVKTVADGKKNLVRIAVKPYTDQPFPKLSEDYLRQIREYLEPRRMLTTRIELLQPDYVPVAVSATVTITNNVALAEEEIRQLLGKLLDHVKGDAPFGGWVRFHEIYRQLNALPCVEAVEALSLLPENRGGVMVGSDVKLDDHCLCCPGTVRLNLRQRGR